uniref:Uncharacterized protein n=1 Tax=Chromera velia CCMP2878 TaxID=1169474 RepID=A0A0G4F0X7_9ALVE|eukprot:Cvel_14504.t1-p1 / transcript=Cvel_14504.t1 / gene=Cvel_14504 / organism=Chromera_velia_CCMP2878 / gene_product=hypothetical protein / transcript_product=hypothetical protein / location=Cvel_scaffold1034:52980-54160(+) / protein_length=216 / sequence_SO=supercontig / SO=protein_coding / is_pseudo=false
MAGLVDRVCEVVRRAWRPENQMHTVFCFLLLVRVVRGVAGHFVQQLQNARPARPVPMESLKSPREAQGSDDQASALKSETDAQGSDQASASASTSRASTGESLESFLSTSNLGLTLSPSAQAAAPTTSAKDATTGTNAEREAQNNNSDKDDEEYINISEEEAHDAKVAMEGKIHDKGPQIYRELRSFGWRLLQTLELVPLPPETDVQPPVETAAAA